MKKSIFICSLFVLFGTSTVFSKTAIVYCYSDTKPRTCYTTVLNYNLDCDSFQPAPGIYIEDCWNFLSGGGGGTFPPDVATLETFTGNENFDIKTDGVIFYSFEKQTGRLTELLNVNKIPNLPENYYVKFFVNNGKSEKFVQFVVGSGNPLASINKTNVEFHYEISVPIGESQVKNSFIITGGEKFIEATIVHPQEINNVILLEVYDITGRKINESKIVENKAIVNNISNSGIYISIIKTLKGEILYTQKVYVY